jgi:predicted nucleic acid-binding protein
METNIGPDRPGEPVSIARIVAVLSELSFDLMRSVRSAVPAALRAQLGAEIDADRLDSVADAILAETAERYRVAAGATILAIGARSRGSR